MSSNQILDIVVIGGGITGAGIARDAALRGLRVALFEKGDFGSGTSSKSSKLIHGGLRYLEHGEIALVFESVSERRIQSLMAPHIVRPLAFLVPIYEKSKVGLETMNIGLWIYDTLALFRAHKMHKTFRGDKARKLEPNLKQEGLEGAIEYYDCFTDDARLVLENIISANTAGAECYSYTEVVALERNNNRISAVRVRDTLTNEERTVATHSVIMATGPWTDEVAAAIGVKLKGPLLRPTKGVHLVFPREKLPLDRAITLISPIDGRVMFAIPWRGRTVIGTTDTDYEGSANDVWAEKADVEYLCRAANTYFPNADFAPKDVIATWAGLRPLIHEEAEDASDVSREHQIYVREDGVVIIAGGKLTTYRIMAKEVVRATIGWLKDLDIDLFDDREIKRPRTKKRPLPGAVGLSQASVKGVKKLAKSISKEQDLSADTADHLSRVYGVRGRKVAALIEKNPALGEQIQSDLPYVWAEVDFAVTEDLAKTVTDTLSRRVPLLLVGLDQGLDVADRVADRMSELLGWTSDQRDRHLAVYREDVAESRKFRD